MLTQLYRKLVPAPVRDTVYRTFLGRFLNFYRPFRAWLGATRRGESQEVRQAWRILWQKGLSAYPYTWRATYDHTRYDVMHDAQNGLPYVLHHGRRLYFRRQTDGTDDRLIARAYRHLLIEQDPRSAHRYVPDLGQLRGRTLLDIGSAEGIFALDCMDYVEHACLFECDPAWIEALEATFAPWRDKVTIIRKYVSNADNENEITLDTFLQNRPAERLFLKMDIEGYERKAIDGARRLLAQSPGLSGAIAVYHTPDDEPYISRHLAAAGYHTQTTPGFLYYGGGLRHAIVRFSR